MDNPVVINASPLIFFSRGRQMELLHAFAGHFDVPEPVAIEIRKKGESDVTAHALDTLAWLEIVSVPTIPDVIVE